MQHAVYSFSLNNIFHIASPQAAKQQMQAEVHHIYSKQAGTYWQQKSVTHSNVLNEYLSNKQIPKDT